MKALQAGLRAALEFLSDLLEWAFGSRSNPLAQLGALGWFFFWIVTASGLYLYAFFDTGVTQAYASVQSITHAQWWAGGILRSFHRYASDALIIVVLIHLLREFAYDRFHGPRAFGWITGMVALALAYVCGISGYWMVWDQLAQYIAVTTSEWLDVLPIFAGSIARNFLHSGELSGRFFTLMVYIHIAVPLAMLAVMWLHIQRHAVSRINPARPLALATLGALLVLALVFPAVSQAPANLDMAPTRLGIDWFYLLTLPGVERWGGGPMWALLGGTAIVLATFPWLIRRRRPPVAVVHLDECNGCGRCVEDCPFTAVRLGPRSDGLSYEQEAVVDPDLCVSCGICVGACPTSTPFRRATALIPGIELPDHPLADMRAAILAASPALSGPERVIVFRCTQSAALAAPDPGVAVFDVPCVGEVPPSFVDFALSRGHADGVMLAGCREEACYQRLGGRWTEARVAGTRDPRLRERVPRERLAFSWAATTQRAARLADLARFRARLHARAATGGPTAPEIARTVWRRNVRSLLALRWGAQIAWLAAFVTVAGFLSIAPAHQSLAPGEAEIKLSLAHPGQRRIACRELTPQELAKLPINMRRPVNCPRARWPVAVELWINGRRLLAGSYAPTGVWSDGPSVVYRRLEVPAGPLELRLRLRDTARTEGFDYDQSFSVQLAPAQSLAIDFRPDNGGFVLHGATASGARP